MSSQSTNPAWEPYLGDDTLPENISDITFDHKDKNGNNVKFLWGVATSSYQVEGNINTNDWDVFTNIDNINAHVTSLALQWLGKVTMCLEPPGKAADHWNLDVFWQDLKNAKSLGINSYRLSLEWSRIQPNNVNDFDLDAINHYRDMLNLIATNGMSPILTLNHITLPKWALTPPRFVLPFDEDFEQSLKGWQNCDTVNAFVKFVQFVVPKFMDIVQYWITINEPVASVMGAGYLAGVWSPGFNVLSGAIEGVNVMDVLSNLIDAHVKAYDAIKSLAGAEAKVGIAHAMVFPKVSPAPNKFINNLEATAQWDYCFNQFFLESVIEGIENKSVLRDRKNIIIRDDWKKKLDFVGINYYRSIYIKSIFPVVPWYGGIFDEDLNNSTIQHNGLNDLGWEVYPGGLYKFLKYLNDRFDLPILITENGFAEELDGLPGSGVPCGKRASYITAHLAQILHAIGDGVNVLGYVYWSIIDNWEWAYGYLPKTRFGLYTINREDGSRKMTQGAAALEYMIRQGKIGDALTKFQAFSPDDSIQNKV